MASLIEMPTPPQAAETSRSYEPSPRLTALPWSPARSRSAGAWEDFVADFLWVVQVLAPVAGWTLFYEKREPAQAQPPKEGPRSLRHTYQEPHRPKLIPPDWTK